MRRVHSRFPCKVEVLVEIRRKKPKKVKVSGLNLTLAAMDVEARQMNDVIIAASIRHGDTATNCQEPADTLTTEPSETPTHTCQRSRTLPGVKLNQLAQIRENSDQKKITI